MKKLIFLTLLLFLIVFPKSVVFADDSTTSATVSPTATPAPNYTLPYPGILPDNPLYILKTIRDNIVVFFISDPVKKSSFYLLQSDKRLEASWYLLKKAPKDGPLAFTTLSKSTNYLEMAVAQAKQAKTNGLDVSALNGKLKDAVSVHQQIVKDMATLPGANKRELAGEEQRLADIAKSVLEFSAKQ